MARLWSSGFELNSLSGNVELSSTSPSGGGAVTITSSGPRSGTYALSSANSGASGTAFGTYVFAAAVGDGPYYARTYIYITNYPDSLATVFGFFDGTTSRSRIRMATDGSLELWDSAAKIGSSSGVLSLNTWYRVELSFFNNTGSGLLELEGKLDGSSFASSTTSANVGQQDRLIIGFSTSTSYAGLFDDVAINNSSGSFQNSWPGAGSIVHLRPNAAGDSTTWTRAGTDTGTNWNQVSEVTPDDNSRVASLTAGQIDDYNIDSPSALGASDTINLVSLGVRFGASNTPVSGFKLRVKASASGTVEESTEITPNSSTNRTNSNAAPFNPVLTLYDLPGASTTAWTKSDLENAQIGLNLSTANTNFARVYTEWLLVEYVPAVGTSSIKKASGVAQASLKKVSGVAEASIKKLSGVAN